jgi:hypothetical protein
LTKGYWDDAKQTKKRSVGRIFPSEPEQELLRAAAWGSFLAFTRPHLETFEVVREEYRRAVERLPWDSSARPSRNRPDERLAEHHTCGNLRSCEVLLYARGTSGCAATVQLPVQNSAERSRKR